MRDVVESSLFHMKSIIFWQFWRGEGSDGNIQFLTTYCFLLYVETLEMSWKPAKVFPPTSSTSLAKMKDEGQTAV